MKLGDLITRRSVGHVRVGVVTKRSQDQLPDVLARFGLSYQGGKHLEIDGNEARRVLVEIFARDMAYLGEVMTPSEAEACADYALLEIFPSEARFLTNIASLAGTFPANFRDNVARIFKGTDATFSQGVVALGTHIAACVWMEDED